MRILIAGGGIGGLTAALSLHAAGFRDVLVMEAAASIRPIGVGLNILPNAVRELAELGLLDRLAGDAIATEELRLYSRHGELIWREPRGVTAGYRWPQLSIHRGHLQSVLADAVRERLGPDAIVTSTRVVGCAPSGNSVSVEVRQGHDGTTQTHHADLLIGADGVRSAVRASFYPTEGPPPGNGLTMWRGTTWGEPFLTGRSMMVTGTDTDRIVLYPIAKEPHGKRTLINWVAARPVEMDPATAADWHHHATVDDVLKHFGDWRFDWLDIPAIIGAATEVFRYPMVDREPLPQWTFGNATLLGDAAHAMYPMGSNGATQSIIDARVLAQALAANGSIAQALARYEAERRPPMTQLQASNRQYGPEAVITLVHQRAPTGFKNLHEVITEQELAAISDRYAKTAGFDVEHVNTRASLSALTSAKFA
jgi:2-polyprenyl-6-methoxyphenol hydroxylase-like FAD-dependent oxidoreductase